MATLSSCSRLSGGATAFHRRRSRPSRATVITCRNFLAVVRAATAASATATEAATASVPQTKE